MLHVNNDTYVLISSEISRKLRLIQETARKFHFLLRAVILLKMKISAYKVMSSTQGRGLIFRRSPRRRKQKKVCQNGTLIKGDISNFVFFTSVKEFLPVSMELFNRVKNTKLLNKYLP